MESLETSPSSPIRSKTGGGGLLSCFGRLKLKLPWKRRTNNTYRTVGGFRYDPLSYAQNFDDGNLEEDDEESLGRGFSARYAAPSAKTLKQ
jgi:hypothetical protein